MNWTLDLQNVRREDLPSVGGKGANLGQLLAADLPVPGGFCVTTAGYREFLRGEDPDLIAAQAALDEVQAGDVEAARIAGAQVRAAMLKREIPAALSAEIVAAWRRAGQDHTYAVRSSATAEDLPDASFAGQQDTYLNVLGEAALLDRVQACWSSLFTDRAILYRLAQGIDYRDVALSVVVQHMVLPETSGILFTADPLTGHRGVVSIDAGFGLGEALVSGLISADSCRVRKEGWEVINYTPGDKSARIVARDKGGTVTETLLSDLRTARALTDEQAVALAKIGQRIEDLQGCPQDIEWCIAQGELFVVQARPITSLFPVPHPAGSDGSLGLSVCFNHFQVMTDAMLPLGLSAWQHLNPIGKHPTQIGVDSISPWTQTAGGRLYIDISRPLRHPRLRDRLLHALGAVDPLAVEALRRVSARPEFQRGPGIKLLSVLRTLLPFMARALALLLWGRIEGSREGRTRWLHSLIAEVKLRVARAGSAGGAAALREARKQVVALFPKLITLPPYLLAAYGGAALARRIARATPSEAAALTRSLPGNLTTDMDLAVGDLADHARGNPELVAALRADNLDTDALLALPGGEGFVAALDGFLDLYGARAPSEIDLCRTRWREDPSSILRAVAGNLGHDELGQHRARHEALAHEAEQCVSTLVQRSRAGWLGPIKAALTRRWLRLFRELAGLREHPKFGLISALDVLRQQALAAGDTLTLAGAIERREDVFYLNLDELIAAAETPEGQLHSLITSRKEQQRRWAAMSPPRVLTSQGESPVVQLDVDAPDGALVGSSASAGVVEGVARVITDPTREVLQRGEILVAPFTDPGWTPLFINARALVMEVGGLMTHGSVVAREYGIPAVVCVTEATTRIHTGDRLRVDGDQGWVQIIEEGVES